MRESKLQRECVDWIQSYHKKNTVCANWHGGGWSMKGFPDLVCCIKGRFVSFELKVDENKMQPSQRIWRKRIISAGGKHYCVRSLSEFIRCVEKEMMT